MILPKPERDKIRDKAQGYDLILPGSDVLALCNTCDELEAEVERLQKQNRAFRNGMVNIKEAKSIGGLTPQDYANEILQKDDEIIMRTESDD
jgi:hypothetical protein